MKTLIAAMTAIALSLVAAPAALADSSGLVAAYGFDEATGTAVSDSAGGLNPGTISGATRSASGRFGSALSFDGVNDRVNINNSASLQLATGMTLEAWVRPEANNWRTALLKERGAGLSYALYASTDTNRPSAEIQAETRGPSTLPLATWTHLASTYDGATLRLYVNGTQVASRAVTGAIPSGTGALRIGGNAVWGEYFKGLIDEVRVYNRALTAAEIGTDMGRAVVAPAVNQPPTAPVLSGTVTTDDVHLSWTAATDDVGVKEYRVYRDGTLLITRSASTLVYDDMNRPAGTSRYTVVAADDGNLTATSNEVALTVSPDTTPPTVSGVCPASGVPTIHDYITLRPSASDDRGGPVTVRIERDGQTIYGPATQYGAWLWDFDTLALSDGIHTLKLTGRDEAGNEAATPACEWNVHNPVLTVPFTSLTDGQTVSGTVAIKARGLGDGQPLDSSFRPYAVLTGGPGGGPTQGNDYTWNWDTTKVADGDYTLATHLYILDYSGQRATDTIHVTVDNTPDDHAPTVSLGASCGGDTYDYPQLNGTWSDDHGPVTLRVEVDGQTVFGPVTRTGTSGSFSFDWDTRAGANGTHTMRAIARDDAGNETTSDACTWNVQNKALSVPITSLTDGQTVSGTVHITAEPRADGEPLTYRPVSVSLNSVPGVTRVGDYDWTWDTTQAANGDQALTTTLFFQDTGGPRATETIHVNVYNSVPQPTGLTADVRSTGRDVELHWNWVDEIYDYNVYRDGLKIKNTSANYAEDLDVPSGAHTYTVKAVQGANESAASNEATVTITVVPDTTPPVITLQAVCDGRNLNEYIGPINGTATDNGGGPVTVTVDVEDVHVFGPQSVNGAFNFSWDTRKNANGPVVMKVKARDAAGNETVKDCPWTVNNSVLSIPISAPADGATVSGTVNVGFQTLSNGDPTSAPARLYVDGTKVSDGFTYAYAWDTTKVANGLHTLRAEMSWPGYLQTMASSTIQVQVQNAPTGLVAAYGFEETSGTTVTDSSGKGSAGTISGPTSVTGGKFGRALSFDGANDLVTVPDSNPLDLTPGMTLEAWVKPTTTSDWRTVLLKERPGQLAYALYASTDNGRPMTEIAAAAQREARGPSAIPAGSWTHLAATYDGTTLKLYVNGTQVATGTTSGSLFNSTGALRIGGNTIWGEWFSGLIDEVRVYERALTAAEIAADRDRPVVAGS